MHLFARSVSPSVSLSVLECTTARGAVLYDLEARMYARNVCCVTQNHLTLRPPGQARGSRPGEHDNIKVQLLNVQRIWMVGLFPVWIFWQEVFQFSGYEMRKKKCCNNL